MTPPKYEIHETTCPRLCQQFEEIFLETLEHPFKKTCRHKWHNCTCTGPSMVAVDRAALEELVDAADNGRNYIGSSGTQSGYFWKRLDAALRPFRRGEK